jgi:organic radical activating enzyme
MPPAGGGVVTPLYGLEYLSEIGENDLLFAAVNPGNQRNMQNYLSQNNIDLELIDGHAIHWPLQSSVCRKMSETGRLVVEDCSGCTRLNHTCKVLKQNIMKYKGVRENENGAGLTLIGCILGKICTLRCEHCVERVPYVKPADKRFYSADAIISDIYKLAESNRFITMLDFVGGEPFLHPDLPEIIKEARKIENIGIINVFTNGTVVPGDELLEQLKSDYVTVDLSNYSMSLNQRQKNKIIRTKEILVKHGVHLFEATDFSWSDNNSFDWVRDDDARLAYRFSRCTLKDCYRLADGKMFRCLHHYAGYASGKLSIDSSVVDIRDADRKTLARQLNEFLALPYIDACRRCELPFDAQLVRSGKQLPLRRMK